MLDLDEITSSPPSRDPGISQLQGQIKNIMIPLLIKIFQLRLEVQQTASPPSRLQNSKPKICLEDLVGQLNRLNEDLKLLQIWNQSCQTQIEKVLQEAKQESCSSLGSSIKPDYKVHPAVQKSFRGAILSGKEESTKKNTLSFWKKWLKKVSP